MQGFTAAAAAFGLALLAATPGLAAEGDVWTWSGYGHSGSNKCFTYKMDISVTEQGGRAIGLFQQEGRPQRNFDLPLGADGSFKGTAMLGQGNTIAVSGKLGDGAKIKLDGYCVFDGPLVQG
jgi:hypothetical protein